MITPLYVGFNQVGLLDTPRLAVILAAAAKAVPFYIVLVRSTFDHLRSSDFARFT